MFPSLLALRALKEKRYTQAVSHFPDGETMLFAFTQLSEINSQFVPIALSELLADTALADVERDGL
ncbi:hypothetical protein BN961_03273 [Afipia felis]|uniref:Uncharacterized protein n=1 Tax=Afipia felis TaxID=1035 RepID=A0A090MR65_AFIFE|nr:hypothetical protein BN961_03273 [Afipia felis]